MPGYQSYDIRLVQIRNSQKYSEVLYKEPSGLEPNLGFVLYICCSFLSSLLKEINNFFELQQ